MSPVIKLPESEGLGASIPPGGNKIFFRAIFIGTSLNPLEGSFTFLLEGKEPGMRPFVEPGRKFCTSHPWSDPQCLKSN